MSATWNPEESITPHDPCIKWKTADLNGKTYEYILAEPLCSIKNTIFLIHGFPDHAFGWRRQIPFLISLGFRVIAPNMMGYGGTDAPKSLEFYTIKRACDDLATLANQLGLTSIFVGGHDWGGSVAYRFVMRYPNLISKLFVLSTPFFAPRDEYIPLTVLPNFKYQTQFASGEVERFVQGENMLKQLISGIFGGVTPTGELACSVSHGIFLERLESIGPPKLLSPEEVNFYVKSYSKSGLRGPLNWYRTGELNFNEDLELKPCAEDNKFIHIPVLFAITTRDKALPPSLSDGMEKWFTDLKKVEIDSDHWVMIEKSAEVNRHIKEFLCDFNASL